MNPFIIIACLVLYGLTFLCFFIPFKCGQKLTGQLVAVILGLLITLTLIGNLDFLAAFILPIIVIFQIIFIAYWTLRFSGRRKAGKITAFLLASIFLLILLSPWISDWTYNKKDVKKVLLFHGIELNDNFKILKNESGGFRDYYETFTLKISDRDFRVISGGIKTSKNFQRFFKDYYKLPTAHYNTYDTVDFETPNQFQREYFSRKKMENG
ncbi:MAG TPA: hypothetical protein VF540_08840, partial [Segetibacter sp.]